MPLELLFWQDPSKAWENMFLESSFYKSPPPPPKESVTAQIGEKVHKGILRKKQNNGPETSQKILTVDHLTVVADVTTVLDKEHNNRDDLLLDL